MGIDFPLALVLLGALLLIASGLSGWLHGTVLSIAVLAVAGGVVLALAGILDVEPDSEGLVEVVELALILTLFTDGLTVEQELLRERWRDPIRALVVAMPLPLILTALAAKALFPELPWLEALLIGSVLAPTDPVVTSTVVSSLRVPAKVRHALNLESGLNDGLALPFVLVLLVATSPGGGDAGAEALQTAGESVAGAVIGGGLAYGAGWLFARLPGGGLQERYEGVYALAVPLLAYGVAEATIGNGLVATFVAGIALGIRIPEVPQAFPRFNENLSSILQVVTFVLFGRPGRQHQQQRRAARRGGARDRAAADRAPAGDRGVLRAQQPRPPREGVHRLVRAQGGRLDALRPVRARVGRAGSPAGLRDRVLRHPRVDRGSRVDRHGRRALGRAQARGRRCGDLRKRQITR